MLRPKALDHVASKETDMAQSLRFYQQVLGFELRVEGPTHTTP